MPEKEHLSDKDIEVIAADLANFIMIKVTAECLVDIRKNMNVIFKRMEEKLNDNTY